MLTSWLAQQTWAANTRRSWRSTLRSFWAWAAQAGHVASSPAAALPTVPQHIGTPRPAPEQVVQTGTSITDTRVRLMIRLAAWAGLRCCEICRVHTDDLEQDLVGWSLRVLGKGSKIRVVPLPRRLALELRSQDAGWVFPGKIDGHLSAHRVSELISAALPVGVTAHMLRHRFASATYQTSGHDIRAVQELLGHSSVATTQIYTAIQSDALRRAVEGAAA
jgi:site-specific recombinase XerD